MSFFRKFKGVCIALCFLAGSWQTTASGTSDFDRVSARERLLWTNLTFAYSNLIATLNVHIQLETPLKIHEELFVKMGTSSLSPMADGMMLMSVNIKSRGLFFFNERYEEKIWFNSNELRAYRRTLWRKKGDPSIKIYDWTDNRVRRRKIQPAGPSESRQAPTEWTRSAASFYSYSEKKLPSEGISDPMLLLYALSTLEPDGMKRSHEMVVFGKKQFHRLTCRPEKTLPLAVSFSVHAASGVKHVDTTIEPFVFLIDTVSLTPENGKPENFSLLGLEKDIRVYIAPSRRLPVRVSGKNSKHGNLVFELSEACLD